MKLNFVKHEMLNQHDCLNLVNNFYLNEDISCDFTSKHQFHQCLFFFNFSIIWMLGRVNKWFNSWLYISINLEKFKNYSIPGASPELLTEPFWSWNVGTDIFSLKVSWMILLGSLVRYLETWPVCSKPMEVVPPKEENLITWSWHSINIILIFWIM